MRLRLNAGASYKLNTPEGVIHFATSSPEHDVPDAVVEKLGLLRERVPVYGGEGSLADNVARFVVANGVAGAQQDQLVPATGRRSRRTFETPATDPVDPTA